MRFTACMALEVALLLGLGCGRGAAGEKRVRTDLYGDPLPPGAIARLGTSRLQHDGPVHALVYSPDGKWLASAGHSGVIRFWDAETGKEAFHLEGHEPFVQALAFVPAGEDKPAQLLVSAGEDKTVRIWDLKTGKERARINHPEGVTELSVSPDGKLIASASYGASTIYVWNATDGKEVRRLKAHPFGVTALAFTPDGKALASGGLVQRFNRKVENSKDIYEIALWEVNTGKRRCTLTGHTWSKVFATDGSLITGGSDEMDDPGLWLWHPTTGKKRRAFDAKSDVIFPANLTLSRDGKTMAVNDIVQLQVVDAARIKLFDFGRGTKLWQLPTRFATCSHLLAFSPDGQTLATVRDNGRITFWDVARHRRREMGSAHVEPLTSAAVAPDGKTIITTSLGEGAWLWDRATSKPLRQLKDAKRPGYPGVVCAAYSPDSQTIALAHELQDGFTLWDVATGKLRRPIVMEKYEWLVSLAYSPDGKWLATQSIVPSRVLLWDVSRGRLQRTFSYGDENTVGGSGVAFSPDGQLLASVTHDGLHVWRTGTGTRVLLKRGSEGSSVAFSPGGILVARACSQCLEVFDVATGANLARIPIERPCDKVKGLAFSPDGRLVAFADTDRIKLWDLGSRRTIRDFVGHQDSIRALAFTPDGKALVSAGADSTALIWDVTGILPPGQGAGKIEWKQLGGSDRLAVYNAFCRLRASPEAALRLLKKNLKPTVVLPAEHLASLIKKLDSDTFTVREQAAQELTKHGLAAEKALRQAAQSKQSPEVARRIALLLREVRTGEEWQRTLIALKVLEDLRSPAARELLQNLARGNPDSRLTIEARAILQRIPPGPEPKSSPARPH